jgi:hypothetical protein
MRASFLKRASSTIESNPTATQKTSSQLRFTLNDSQLQRADQRQTDKRALYSRPNILNVFSRGSVSHWQPLKPHTCTNPSPKGCRYIVNGKQARFEVSEQTGESEAATQGGGLQISLIQQVRISFSESSQSRRRCEQRVASE